LDGKVSGITDAQCNHEDLSVVTLLWPQALTRTKAQSPRRYSRKCKFL